MEVESAATTPEKLVAALEQATLMAKQLPTTTDPSKLLQILTTLSSAHHHLSLILSNHTSAAVDDGDPMVIEDDLNSRDVEKVASKMRDCFIQNKRPKRMLSPTAEMGGSTADVDFDYSDGGRLRSLDLIYQFHA